MNGGVEHWNAEYAAGSPHFHIFASDKPSNSVIRFTDYLTQRGIPLAGTVLETGCGMGRNSHYLAEQGFEVIGADISDVAITEAKRRTKVANLPVRYEVFDVSTPWPLTDSSVDYILDLGTSHLLTLPQLQNYREQLLRVLDTNGKLLLYTPDRSKDQESQRLLRECPGPEENTYILPEMNHLMNHLERTFTKEDIEGFYHPLRVESSELIHLPTRFGNKTYDRYYWWVLLTR